MTAQQSLITGASVGAVAALVLTILWYMGHFV